MKTIFLLTIRSAVRDLYLLVWSLLIPVTSIIFIGMFIKEPVYRQHISVGIVVASIIFYAFSTTAYIIMAQRKRGVYSLLKITSMKLWEYVCSLSSAWILISVFCGVFIFSVCTVFFDIKTSFIAFVGLLPIFIIGAAGYIFFAFFISSIAKNEAHMSMITNLIIFPLLLCSNAFYSLENVPFVFRMLQRLNPVQWFLNAIHATLNLNISSYLISIVLLLFFLLGMLGISLKTFYYTNN